MRLSEHFSLAEATKSQTALRLGIDNAPDDDTIARMIAVAETVLEPVRKHYGVPFSPSSWYRSPTLNEAIGSKPTSQHVSGEAVDFEVHGIANLELARWCRENISFDQLIMEFWSPDDDAAGWVHCSYTEERRNRAEVLTIGSGGTIIGLPKA